MKVVIVLVVVLALRNHSSDCYDVSKDARRKTWKYDADIGNPANWIGGKMHPDCRGVHFAEENSAPIFLEKMQVEELVLPRTGELWLLDGGFVQFGGQGDDSFVDSNKDYCIKVKPQDYQYWYDWTSWLQEPPDNTAVPHQERLPCFYDTVIFPKSYHTRADIGYFPNYVARVKYGLATYDSQDNDDFDRLQKSQVGKAVFRNQFDDEYPIAIARPKLSCTRPEWHWPCPCHAEYVPCMEMTLADYVSECEKPIQPYGFCHGICGAFLTIELDKDKHVDVARLRRMLDKYESDTHASVVATDYGPDVVQVVFSEKVYRMKSALEIEDFRAKLLAEKLSLRDYAQSGSVHIEGETASTVALIFGTLVGVLLVFAIFFAVFKDGDAGWLGGNRFRFNTSRSFFDQLLFARFDTQNESLIVDGQSLAGSVQNLHRQSRSFDNPMYGSDAASKEPLAQEEELVEKTPHSVRVKLLSQKSNEVENPLYDIALQNVNEE